MTRTLGQVNSAAYRFAMKTGGTFRHDEHAWQAAAEAVVRETNAIQRGEREWGEPVIDDLDARMPEAVLDRAVIEAAKAWCDGGTVSECQEHLNRLELAVEALQEVEGESA